MKKYTYPPSSQVHEVVFKQAPNGTSRAYLCAGEGASIDDLVSITKMLCEQGYFAIHAICDGKPALEIRGFLRDRELINLIEGRGWAEGAPKITKDTSEKKSFTETIRDKSLPLASAGFILADVGYTMYGHKSSRPEDTAAGLSYMVGSATMGLLGTDAQAMAEIKKQTRKLLTYARDHRLDISQNLTIPVVTENNKRSVFQKIIDTLQTYPAEIGNSFTALAGALIAYSSYKYRVGPNMSIPAASMSHADKVAHSAGLKDIGLGLTTLTSGMIGAWVKEKKHDPDSPETKGAKTFWDWVQERPLRIAGIGYMISTGFHTLSTIQEYKHAKMSGDAKSLSAVPWRALFIGSTILAEVLLTISSKGHGDGVKSDPSTDDSVIAVAAEMITQQKPAMQQDLINHIGNFLGRPDVLGGKDAEIIAKLSQQVEMMRKNPWIEATKRASEEVAATKPEMLPSDNSWQQKVSASQAVPSQLGA